MTQGEDCRQAASAAPASLVATGEGEGEELVYVSLPVSKGWEGEGKKAHEYLYRMKA